MSWPARWEHRTLDRRLVANIDIAPTVADAAGAMGLDADGRSLLDGSQERSILVSEFWRKPGDQRSTVPDWTSIRTHAYQYVEYTRGERIIAREYYSFEDDPWQLRNLLGDSNKSNDPNVSRLHRTLLRVRACQGSSCN
jgi:arylsulfatase A-like enzyme